jgi:hypothetical protein
MSVNTNVTVPDGCATAATAGFSCRHPVIRNVGRRTDGVAATGQGWAMQSTICLEEPVMLKKHLTRLTVMVVTGSILVASYAEMALAGIRHG